MIEWLFYMFAGLTIASALVILLTRNILYAAFSLVVTFLGVAALYVLAGADFIAVTQIMVYVGGVIVLMIFGVMFTNKVQGKPITTAVHNRVWGVLISVGLFAFLFAFILRMNWNALGWISRSEELTVDGSGTIHRLGTGLMTDYLLPFELAGILLLIALVGAAFVARRQLD
ncbi:NADH-quinone oxidoreductase subunit J [Roseivirga sp. BDSF3-8]|uniref:NADH-quinone oxidoreductase subunit J family protein n=1 Tax=Roseivirga sp. BDSF3-8 TaxID=3241598 RepID=UPI00353260D9